MAAIIFSDFRAEPTLWAAFNFWCVGTFHTEFEYFATFHIEIILWSFERVMVNYWNDQNYLFFPVTTPFRM